ncbi:MAG: hypothetical protein DRN96_09535 [Thermoproteota archaeon]|nr:MAG: hypothetical protein DRN96_09535 [Candidatus Korarchaeota archaeon]
MGYELELVIYPGCLASTELYACELSARRVLDALEVPYRDAEGLSCCGMPVKSMSTLAWLYLSARNLALAEEHGGDLLTLCSVCDFHISEARRVLKHSRELRAKVEELLDQEGLRYAGRARAVSMLAVLAEAAESGKLAESRGLSGLKVAAHYGCQTLRPSDMPRPDHPEAPGRLEAIVKALGGEPVDYPEKLSCCGGILVYTRREAALTLAGEKVAAAQERGADLIVTPCPHCMKMLDQSQKAAAGVVGKPLSTPVLYATQLVGLALGLSEEELGLDLNSSPVEKVLERLG